MNNINYAVHTTSIDNFNANNNAIQSDNASQTFFNNPTNVTNSITHINNLTKRNISILDKNLILAYFKQLDTPKQLASRFSIGNLNHINYLSVAGSFCVFTISALPNLVFKVADCKEKITERVLLKQQVENIIKEQNFDRLIVPKSIILDINFAGKYHQIIIENELAIMKKPFPEIYYANYEHQLEQAVIQMAHLICATGINDIKPANLPLLWNENTLQFCFALVDLEIIPSNNIAEGILGGDYSYGEPALGLLYYFPRYAEQIIEVVRNTLPASRLKIIKGKLHHALQKSREIIARENDIERFHREKNIKHGDSAITKSTTNIIIQETEKLKQSNDNNIKDIIPSNDIINQIISDINAVIKNQEKVFMRSIHAREWRFTLNYYTTDSNKRSYIYDNSRYIANILIPILSKNKIIHSVLESEEVTNLNIQARKKSLGSYDRIIQF